MALDLLKRLLFFAILLVAQALVLNHIHLFNCATPLLYVYLVLLFPRNFPKWAILLWSFALGLCVDSFTNTPGVAAGSMTYWFTFTHLFGKWRKAFDFKAMIWMNRIAGMVVMIIGIALLGEGAYEIIFK